VAEFYFAYGSNMSSARLRARVSDARAIGAARLPGFGLVFDKPGRDGTAKANLQPARGAVAHGVLWEMEAEALSRLDDFEPGYTRRLHLVEAPSSSTMGARIEAWAYLHPGSDLETSPSPAYLRHLLDGVREHALPSEMRHRLEALLRAAGRC
jgi:gamma-glutamylcyclotransferase (GGCT)/AIG2-like uncharacterized protein YtfP